MSYKRISKAVLLIPWESWRSLMKTLSRALDAFLIADLACKEIGWGNAGFSAEAQMFQKLGSAFTTPAGPEWHETMEMILPEGIGVPVHQTRMLSHIMGLSLAGDDQAVLSYEGKGFWWTKCVQKTWQKDPNTTYHLAPAPCFPHSLPALHSAGNTNTVDGTCVWCAQL